MDSPNREPTNGGNSRWSDIRFFILALVFYILATLLWFATWRAVGWPAVRERIRERRESQLSTAVGPSSRETTTALEQWLTESEDVKEEVLSHGDSEREG